MDARTFLIKTLILFCGASFALPQSARAFVFSPMSVEFDTTGPGATRSFSVENDGTNAIAVEFAIYPRTQDIEGNEPAEDRAAPEKRFIVYPPQVLLQPKEKRTLRVTWVGESQLDRELPFRIVAEQLRLDTEKKQKDKQGGAMIDLLLKYKGALYVRPRDAKPDLVLKGTEAVLPAPQPAGKKKRKAKGAAKTEEPAPTNDAKIIVVLENRGKAHQLLGDLQLRASAKGTEVLLKSQEIPEITSQNVLAGGVRRFSIPWPKGLPQGPLQVKLEWAEELQK